MAYATPGNKTTWEKHIKGTGSPATLTKAGKSPKATSMPSAGSKAK